MSEQAGAEVRTGTADEKDCETEKMRIRKAFWLCIVGLACIFVLIIVLVYKGKGADDIVSIVGIITGVLGTLVGAFFGAQIGSAGKDDAEKRAKIAHKELVSLVFDLTDKQKENLSPEVKKMFSR